MLAERRFPTNRRGFTRERLIGAAIVKCFGSAGDQYLNQVEQVIREATTKARL